MKKRGNNYCLSSSHSSQATLEFIMSYGWTVAVALIAIGTLAYFGILNPDNFLPRRCIFGSGIECMDFRVDESSVTFMIRNGKGEDLSISDINVKSCTGTDSGFLKNGEQATFIVDGCRNKANSKFISDVNITFVGDTGLSHKNIGNIVGRVEAGGATPATPPSAPLSLNAAAGNAQIVLSWDAPSSNGGSSTLNYIIYRGASSGSETFLKSVTSISDTDTGLTNAQAYYYQVTALNIAGESNRSNEASATPCSPSVIVTYGSWNSCSASCGGGIQSRTNVNQCGQNVQETQSCNNQACCDPNVVVSCESWSACSTKCGSGTQTRACTNQCGQNVQETQSCYDDTDLNQKPSCGNWGECSVDCGYGQISRQCYQVCKGNNIESVECVGVNGKQYDLCGPDGEPGNNCNAGTCSDGLCYKDSNCQCTFSGCLGDANTGNGKGPFCYYYTCPNSATYCDSSEHSSVCG